MSFAAALIAAGCSKEIKPEITSLDVSRLFSPLDVDARVVNRTAVRLNWKEVNKAKSYVIEFFANGNEDYSGTPVRTVSDIIFDQVPYTVTGLEGETDYSVRIKAVGENISDSKWVSATFKTDPEQLFSPIDPNDLQATQVTLRWVPGETVTGIVLTPGNITHAITQQEMAAGAATVTGLTGETNYTARIMNGSKVRGTVTFTTLIDLGGAIAVNPSDDLTALLTAASEGDVFALFPGEYTTQDITLTRSVSIKGVRPAEKPVLMGTVFRVSNGAALQLKDLILDGTGSKDGNQAIIYETDGTYGALKIEDCTIKDYTKGTLYVNKKCLIESVSIKGCIYSNIECNGGDFIDFRTGLAKTFEYINNTAYNSALARDFFRMDAGGSTNFPGVKSTITIRNNTFNNVSNGNSRRILYIRLALHEISFTKNILANTEGYYTNQAATTILEMSKNNYFNAPNFTGSTQSNAKNDNGDYTTLNPNFTNPASGDFTVNNDDLKFQMIGDPRWLK